MSMQICVFADRLLDSISEWQRAIDAESFPLWLSNDVPLSEVDGVLPGRLGDQPTGFEFHPRDAKEMMEFYSRTNFAHDWKYAHVFIWGGLNPANSPASWMAATAYARATGGVIYDEEEGKLFSPEAAVAVARDLERFLPELNERIRQLAARPREA